MKFKVPKKHYAAKTAKELAKEAGCSVVTVYRWLESAYETDSILLAYTMVRRGKSGPMAKAYWRYA